MDRGLAIIGGGGSGRSTALRALAAQSRRTVQIPADPERAWDAIVALDDAASTTAELVLCDDLDQLIAGLPTDHAQALLERLEKAIRSAGVRRRTFVIATGRVSGQVARVIDALPTRMLLRTGTKLEHLAAGGDNDGYRRDRPAGRARVDGIEVQIAWADPSAEIEVEPVALGWTPSADVVGVVAVGVRRAADALRATHPQCEVIPLADPLPEPSGKIPTILVGDAESWQRQWTLWQRIRTDGEMLVLAECTAELRSLAGCRELPPYAEAHRGRAWSVHDGRAPRRVVIAQLDPMSEG